MTATAQGDSSDSLALRRRASCASSSARATATAGGRSPRTVTEIVAATGSTQANVSKHLALLASAGILEREKDGQCVYYGMKDKLVMQLCELVRAQLAD